MSSRHLIFLAALSIPLLAWNPVLQSPDGRIRLDLPTEGSFRALAVFIRFRDDTTFNSGATVAARQWAYPDTLPAIGRRLLSSSPEPPFEKYLLTEYYHRQSNGHFHLYGEVYPHVLVTEHDEMYYRGWGGVLVRPKLSLELLQRLDEDPRFNLSDFDANADGFLDHVFIILRGFNHLMLNPKKAAGISDLGYESKVDEFGSQPGQLKRVSTDYSGSYVLYNSAGVIIPEIDLVRLMAHEFGHDMWADEVSQTRYHFEPMGGDYGVPANGSGQVAFHLLAARGDRGGDRIISAYERDVLNANWIDCVTLTRDTSVTVRDLYSADASNCFKLEIPEDGSNPQRTMYLSNRQRIGPFDRLQYSESTASEHGLMTTGLLATLAVRDRIAVIAADNSLDIGTQSAVYSGDMFAPDSKTQLTPWTHPNINGYSEYPPGFVMAAEHFQAVENVRTDPHDPNALRFDYCSDFRERPVIREDSWLGAESQGMIFRGDVLVTDRSTLDVGTHVMFDAGLRVDHGSTIRIEPEATVVISSTGALDLRDKSEVVVFGRLISDGRLVTDDDSSIRVEEGGEVDGVVAVEGGDPSGSRCIREVAAYPNPAVDVVNVAVDLGSSGEVGVEVFDVLGRLVARPVRRELFGRGRHAFRWDGGGYASGLYHVRVDVDRCAPEVVSVVVGIGD